MLETVVSWRDWDCVVEGLTFKSRQGSNLAMRKICVKLRQPKAEACEDLLQRVKQDPGFLWNAVTRKTKVGLWIRPGSKASILQYHLVQKAKPECSWFSSMPRWWSTTNLYVCTSYFRDRYRMVLFYIEVLRRLKGRLVVAKNWKVHHVNAPSYT